MIAIAQKNNITGYLFDEEGKPLMYATAVLLNPADSTMTNYAISDTDGKFTIKNIKAGKYILQTGFIGYESYFKNIEYPLASGNDLGGIAMKPKAESLDEVQISANRIPILIKKDTMEYVANAFKTKPDASAEELLKKLPGVKVDRAGNIKAHGENVNRVLVDGKEFFSGDPKVATKNLPADAIDKVQVYNKKSDATELTGIEDGSYQKTINMILKDGKKSAYFGDVTAGYGTEDIYQAGAKLFRFTKKNQFAALGMLNNINKVGFSFQDYLNFQGGLQSIMSGGGGSFVIGGDGNMPINFGQSIDGLTKSGAAGLNFTHEARKNNRFNISYMGNGTNNHLVQNNKTQNFSDAGDYNQVQDNDNHSKNRSHRVNFNWRNRIDDSQHLNLKGSVGITDASGNSNSTISTFQNDVLMNNLKSLTDSDANSVNINTNASYMTKGKGAWKLFSFDAKIATNQKLDKSDWNNITNFLNKSTLIENKYQEDENSSFNASANASATLKLSKLYYIVPSIYSGISHKSLVRDHFSEDLLINDLSINFEKRQSNILSGLSLKRNTKKSQISFSLKLNQISMDVYSDNHLMKDIHYTYLMPSASWSYEYKTAKRINFNYNTNVNTPEANQLLTVKNTQNTLQIYRGNLNLKPEYSHNLSLHWIMFDQFSSTSIFANASATYTKDKINFSRNILENFVQEIDLLNVDYDYRANASIELSTPIRKLGIDLRLTLSESWNKGINLVNGKENVNTNLSHTLGIILNNRKNEKIDVTLGSTFSFSNAKYSIQQDLNRNYFNLSAYTDIRITPNDKWLFAFSADITHYTEKSFGEAVNIPILKAEISRYFLKNKRAVLTLEAFDLLDKNKGYSRVSTMNYLMEKRSNVIGRYVMLTFKFKLNKFDNNRGFKIEVKSRHR